MSHLLLPLTVLLQVGCEGAVKERPVQTAEVLYETCIPCHGAQAEGRLLAKAPPLAGMPAWYLSEQLEKFRSGKRGAHPDDVNGLRMRPVARSLVDDEQIEKLAKWLSEKSAHTQPTPAHGDIEAGKLAYQVCSACHGPNAEGIEAMGAPALRNLPYWYFSAQLSSFLAGYRGGPNDDPDAQGMRGMASLAATPEARENLNAYIQSLNSQ